MLNNTALAPHVRNPACGSCGGTGYVYLWSIDPAGSRAWFCDRSTCKRFWQAAGSIAKVDVKMYEELQPLVSSAHQPVFQPV
jgi:hypothetical protein